MSANTQIEIKFRAFDYKILDVEVGRVVDTVRKTGATIHGPIPMPKKIERFTVNRSPHIDKESREQFEIRTFRRNMIINPSDQTIDALMKLELASGVEVEIKVLDGGKKMTKVARRSGLITTKIGMTQIFTEEGKAIPVTLLKVDRNVVLKANDAETYKSVQIGYGVTAKSKKIKKPQAGLAKKAGIDSFKISKEFRVTDGFLLDVGTELNADHFKVGQIIDVTSISIGKGFAGGMKRYGFAGLEASHGVSISHRALGSTGQRQDPGKTFKGKKMHGHMGAKQVTTQNLQVVDVDTELSIIAVKGAIPGHKGQTVYVTDAIKLGYIEG